MSNQAEKSRAAAVLAVMNAVAQVPAGASDPNVAIGELQDGSGWWWSLTYRVREGNTQAVFSETRRFDRPAFALAVMEQIEAHHG